VAKEAGRSLAEIMDERDAAVAVISAIEERYIDGFDTYKDWKFMGDTARAFLSENVKEHLPPRSGSKNKQDASGG
jgi:hypothetical protein